MGAAVGTAIDPSTLDPTDPNACPQGCSVCGTEDGQTEKWIEQLKRFDACRKNTAKVRECLPTMDHDGSLVKGEAALRHRERYGRHEKDHRRVRCGCHEGARGALGLPKDGD